MTQTLGLEALRANVVGRVIDESDPDYDTARAVWHGAVDHRPAAVVRCAGPTDVAAAVAFGREHGLEISVRGGGHNPWGVAVAEGGVVIDLSELRTISVNPATRRAWCGGGATIAELDAATQRHGLAVPTGLISDIGVGGLTLGGGYGWLSRHAGLAADNLRAAEIVTADGRSLRVSADNHPDLFWALRGGGGNFGVVTGFEFQLHEVGQVHLGLFFWGLDKGPEVLRLGREVLASLPRAAGFQLIAGLTAPPAPFVPVSHHGEQGYMLVAVGFGSARAHTRLVDQVRAALPPLFELVSPLPYVELQKLFDSFAPTGIYAYEKNLYLRELSDEAIATLVEHLPDKTSPTSFVRILGLGGAIADVADQDTAFSGDRNNRLMLGMVALTADARSHQADRAWAREAWQTLRPYASGSREFINFMVDNDDDRVRASYGPEKYQRLAQVKARYDGDNVFHLNANIKPAAESTSSSGRETRMSTITQETQLTPETIMKLGMAYWGSKVLLTAVELGLFTELADAGPLDGKALRERLGLHPRSATDFFDALVTLGMLERQGGRYANTPETELFLDRAKQSTYMGGVLEMANTTLYHNWGLLTESLRTGAPQSEAKTGKDFFEVLYADKAKTEQFVKGMAGASNYIGQMLAAKFPWQDYGSVIDIGCSGGTASIQIALAHEHITGGGFDLPPLGPIFDERVAEFGLSDRLSFTPGDFFTDPLPHADVLVMGQLLHGFTLEQRQLLLQKAHTALPDGGALIVYDAIIDDERRSNTYGLLMSLTMLLQTTGGFESTGAEYQAWMKKTGFSDTYVRHLTGPHSMVVGIK
jgi:cyclopropane fatty-acyl-phospholipid synthase-like methyltransferase